jgi:polysaccharide biosynthesis transport protein
MQESSDTGSIDIKKYWGLIVRRKYLVIAVALLVLTVCTAYSYRGDLIYEAKCTVFVQRNVMVDPLIRGGSVNSIDVQLRTLTERISSPSFLERVLFRLDASNKNKNERTIKWLVKEIQQNLTVTVRGSERAADLFVIAYRGTSPTLVRDTVNTLVNQYIDENLEVSRSDASGAIEFLQKEIEEYKAKLEATDKAMAAYNAAMQAPVPGAAPGLTPYEARLNELNNRLTNLLSQYTENHPDVIRTKDEIATLKKNPQRSLGGAPVSRAPRAEMLRLERERASYQRTYDDLRARLDNAKISRNLNLADGVASLKVVDPAPLPTSPINNKKRVMVILAGFFLGAAAGAGVALGLDLLSPSFKTEESVEARLKLPVLVSIPSIVTESQLESAKKLDRKVYFFAIAYTSVILALLIREALATFLGINIGGF